MCIDNTCVLYIVYDLVSGAMYAIECPELGS